ncbi:hypothetical protein OROMI_012859 [Orobanche minor]
MESQLHQLNPKSDNTQLASLLEPITDDRRLLKSDSTNEIQTSQPSIEELEKKCVAYVRQDVYGIMGLGVLPWTEKFLQ